MEQNRLFRGCKKNPELKLWSTGYAQGHFDANSENKQRGVFHTLGGNEISSKIIMKWSYPFFHLCIFYTVIKISKCVSVKRRVAK